MAKQMTADVGKDVIYFHCEDNEQQHRPIIPIVCHVSEVAECAPKKRKSEHAQTNPLEDVAHGARAVLVIGSDTTEQNPIFGVMLRRAALRPGPEQRRPGAGNQRVPRHAHQTHRHANGHAQQHEDEENDEPPDSDDVAVHDGPSGARLFIRPPWPRA